MAPPRNNKLVEQALTWIVQREGASPAAAATAGSLLREWRAASPQHELAAIEAQQCWDALGSIGPELRDRFAEPERPSAGAYGRRRRNLLLSVAGLLGIGVLGGKTLHWHLQQPTFASTYSTRTAQLMTVHIPDGSPSSRLDFSPQTALAVRLYRHSRVVDFRGGEARFDVASDPSRPFEVHLRDAIIHVVGTAFTVRDRGSSVAIGVERGKIRVTAKPRPDGAASPPTTSTSPEAGIDLRAGEALSLTDGVAGPVRRVDAASLSPWREGWLVFEATPLGEALETINAYRQHPIRSPDPRVNALQLTGRFRTTASASLVDALPLTLPVAAHTHPDGSVTLSAR